MKTPLIAPMPALAMLLACTGVAPAQEMHQHGAHVHGTGALDIAIDGPVLAMEFRAPGADIIGFEHEAHDDADKAALETALAALMTPLSLFAPSEGAGCTVVASEAAFGEAHDGDEEHDEDEEHGADEHDEEEGHDDEHAEHAEFHAEYELSCARPERLERIDFTYFDTFERAQALEIQVITGKGSFGAEVTRDAPVLELKGRI